MGLSHRIAAESVCRNRATPDALRAACRRAAPMGMSVTIVVLAATLPIHAAELYRWIDERGVVNYSNERPPKDANAKELRTVEDNLSVYTPEKRPERPPAQKPPSTPAGAAKEVAPERRATPAPPPLAYDPCANLGPDSNCYDLVPYSGSVFPPPSRPPRLVQPQLPPGTIAGQSTGAGGTIPGQSGTTPAAPLMRSPPKAEPGASFTSKGREPEHERDARR